MTDYVDIVFDGPPSNESGRFIEVEDSNGASFKFGEWVERDDGYWALRLGEPTFVVWQNTNLTDGYGRLIPVGCFVSETDAAAFGAGKDVQGCNCRVTRETVIRLRSDSSNFYGPVDLKPATKEGMAKDEQRRKREAALHRAQELGLSDDEVKALTGSKS